MPLRRHTRGREGCVWPKGARRRGTWTGCWRTCGRSRETSCPVASYRRTGSSCRLRTQKGWTGSEPRRWWRRWRTSPRRWRGTTVRIMPRRPGSRPKGDTSSWSGSKAAALWPPRRAPTPGWGSSSTTCATPATRSRRLWKGGANGEKATRTPATARGFRRRRRGRAGLPEEGSAGGRGGPDRLRRRLDTRARLRQRGGAGVREHSPQGGRDRRLTLLEAARRLPPPGCGSRLHGQAHVVLRQGRRCGPRPRNVVQLGELQAVLERVVSGEAVQHGRHPPGEALCLPDAPETGLGIGLEQVGPARGVEVAERPGEDADVGDGQVHPLGPGRRHDVRGVPGEEEPAVAHRLGDEAAHRDDALLGDLPFRERPVVVGGEPRVELLPDPPVGPVVGVVVGVALEVEALDLRRTSADQGEASLVVRVDQLLRRPRRLDKNTEPAEGIFPLVLGARILRDGGAAHPVETIAPGDEVALQILIFPVLAVDDGRPLGVGAADADALGLEEYLTAGLEPDEVLHHLVLAVERDRPPAGQAAQVDPAPATAELQVYAVVDGPLLLHPVPDARPDQQIDRALLEHPRPDLRLQRFAAAALQHDRVDPFQMQEVREQQPRRPAPDDPYLCAHARRSSLPFGIPLHRVPILSMPEPGRALLSLSRFSDE